MNNQQYVSFSDESYSESNFKSIATFSLKLSHLHQIESELRAILEESGVDEFKWQKLKNAKYSFCAEKLINFVWQSIKEYDARIDVITWNINDSRHQVKNRDDSANYERMFYHLHSNSLRRRPKASQWHLYPDEGVGVDWATVTQYLNFCGQRRERIELPLFRKEFLDNAHYHIVKLEEVKSHESPCCQIADLFAGLSIFSKTDFDLYQEWFEFAHHNISLFPKDEPQMTNAQRYRFQILKYFDDGCKSRKLGVSLKKSQRLKTSNPNNPINFWFYEPQHEMDKAPTKNRSWVIQTDP